VTGRPDALFVGLATLDLVLGVERVPASDEKVVARSQLVAAGGPAANAAVACAWAGVPARLLTVLGSHPLGRVAALDLEARGVEIVDAARDRVAPPPFAAVLVTVSTGARAVVSRTDRDTASVTLPAPAEALVAGAGVVVADGHHAALAEPVLRAARAAGVPTLVDAGTWRPAFAELLPLADIVVASAAFHPPGVGPATGDVLADLLERGAAFAAVTAGSEPIRWRAAAGGSGELPVRRVEVVDTLGAGDVLHGILAALLASRGIAGIAGIGDHLVRSLAEAARVATASCAHPGTRAWLDAQIPRPALR
jgi:sugar/nucleoside kinase (ribokinase family)